jgi:hypothetical protein
LSDVITFYFSVQAKVCDCCSKDACLSPHLHFPREVYHVSLKTDFSVPVFGANLSKTTKNSTKTLKHGYAFRNFELRYRVLFFGTGKRAITVLKNCLA